MKTEESNITSIFELYTVILLEGKKNGKCAHQV